MHRLVKFLLIAVVAMFVVPNRARADERSNELIVHTLQGKWVLVSTEERGEVKRYTNRSLIFEDHEYRFYVKALLVRKAVATLNAGTKPYAMDLLQQIGPTQGQVAKCILKLESDSLTIAQGMYGKERPSDFDSKDATCSSVTVWKRVKE